MRDDDGLLDGFVLHKASRYVIRLDAVSADLDLVVEPAEELKHAVRAPTDAVAGAVELGTWLFREGVREEALLGLLGLANITERYAVSARD
jgi:hypothetical protein